MKCLKAIIDSDIPFIKGVLEPYCSVSYIKGSEINSKVIAGAHALIVRTRTKCDKKLLQGSLVKAIFSATIGSDHIDLDYCDKEGIVVFNAAGCNANGVVQYILTALFALMFKKNLDLREKSIGIIGAGNVGERLAQLMEKFGFFVLRCDPPKSLINNNISYYDLNYVLENSQIVSLNVPLNRETKNICSYSFIEKMKKGAILVNTSRGDVLDQSAVIECSSKLGGLIIDVWKDEPSISEKFVAITDIATPHIAGYSLEGKANATVMTILSFASFFEIDKLKNFKIELPPFEEKPIVDIGENTPMAAAARILLEIFPLWEEDLKLRTNLVDFERIRSEYIYRRELSQNVICELERLISSDN
ncbi:MAG: 4-phosphoerythronate dehydrogenase [Bacteroidales bacterium]